MEQHRYNPLESLQSLVRIYDVAASIQKRFVNLEHSPLRDEIYSIAKGLLNSTSDCSFVENSWIEQLQSQIATLQAQITDQNRMISKMMETQRDVCKTMDDLSSTIRKTSELLDTLPNSCSRWRFEQTMDQVIQIQGEVQAFLGTICGRVSEVKCKLTPS